MAECAEARERRGVTERSGAAWQGGGQETAIMTAITQLAHHGRAWAHSTVIYAPIRCCRSGKNVPFVSEMRALIAGRRSHNERTM